MKLKNTLKAFGTVREVQGQHAMNILRIAANVADGETITIGTQVYEIDTAATATITAGRVRVNCNAGVTPAIASDALIAAVNGNPSSDVTAVDISDNEVLIVHHQLGVNALACTETLGGSNNAWAAAAMYGGVNVPEAVPLLRVMSRAPNAAEVALDDMHFYFPFTPTKVLIDVRVTSGGARKAWDGGYTITGRRVTLSNAGSTDWATTDTVTVLASE